MRANINHSPGPVPPGRARHPFDVPCLGEGTKVKGTVRRRASDERRKFARGCRALDGETFEQFYPQLVRKGPHLAGIGQLHTGQPTPERSLWQEVFHIVTE